MENKRNISYPASGMNRDKDPSDLQENEYSYAMNFTVENKDGSSFKGQNEPSNILCKKFTNNEGDFYVVGYKSDLRDNSVYFFLSFLSGNSQIVKLQNSKYALMLSDELKEDEKGYYNELSTPLEDREDRFDEVCGDFELLIEDCGSDGIKGCLGFDVNTPVYDIVLKDENCGKRLFWAQKGMPPRYLDFEKLKDGFYQRKEEILCGDEDEDDNYTCLNCEKLRVFPRLGVPEIEPEVIQVGGNLPEGVYEFLIAYCDYTGEEISGYYSITNQIHIFDKENVVVTDNSLRFTSLGIRLSVNHLDERASFYKVAIIARLGENMVSKYLVEGIHPISDKSILVNDLNESTMSTITLQRLFTNKATYKTVGGLFTSGQRMLMYDLEAEPEWNLQPIVNLMGPYLKWLTGIATEDLYSDGVNVAKYGGHMRDEVYPFGIKPLCRSGYEPASYPFIGRLAKPYDLEDISPNSDTYKSIHDNSENCSETDRTKRWQMFNTASSIGMVPGTSEMECKEEYTQTQEKSCRGDFVRISGKDNGGNYIDIILDIDPEEEWSGIEDYLSNNPQVLCNNSSSLAQALCNAMKGICPSGETCTDCSSDGTDLFFGSCDNVTHLADKDVVIVDYFEGLAQEFIYKDIADYEEIEVNETSTKSEGDKADLIFGDLDVSTIGGWRCEDEDNPNEDITEDSVQELLLEPIKVLMTYSCSMGCSKGSPYTIAKYSGTVPFIYFTRYSGVYGLLHQTDIEKNIYDALKIDKRDNTDISRLFVSGQTTTYSDSWVKMSNEVKRSLGDRTNRSVGTYSNESYQRFAPDVHKDARWFKIEMPESWKSNPNSLNDDGSKKAYILEFIGTSSYGSKDMDISTSTRCRFTFYKNDKKTIYNNLFGSNLPESYVLNDVSQSILVELNPDSFKDGSSYMNAIYLAIDTPIVYTSYLQKEANYTSDACSDDNFGYAFFTSILPKGISVVLRDLEPTNIKFHFDDVQLSKIKTFQATCTFCIPDITDCKVVPYEFGDFSYWQSDRKYPANKELYNSQEMFGDFVFDENSLRALGFDSEDIDTLNNSGYLTGTTLNDEANFCQKNIRHFKFPDNIINPFMSSQDSNLDAFSDSIIYPIGVTIKKSVVEAFFNLAVKIGLISQEQRDDIYGFEIVRGNRAMSKSVIAAGIGYDMMSYKNSRGNTVFFSNFPYNDLSDNIFLHDDDSRKRFIKHPFNKSSNNKFVFHSPDTSFRKPTLPTECRIEGYVVGKSIGSFQQVEDHPKWVILGKAAYNWAAAFATVEALANYAIKIGTLAAQVGSATYVFVGLSSGTSFFGQMSQVMYWAAFGAELLNQAFVWGKYRYEWLNIFTNNGQLTNFAYYYASRGYYNQFLVNNVEDSQLRGLSIRKYLNSSRRQTPDAGEQFKINNRLRESTVAISFGPNNRYRIFYPSNYSSIDGSRVEDPCIQDQNEAMEDSSDESMNDIASPYMKLKNYSPAQYGDIDSVQWLNTGRHIYFDNTDIYTPVFGGDIYITRHNFKRKHAFFYATDMGNGDMIPFAYNDYKNVAFPTYYVNFETKEDSASQGSGIFPNRQSYYKVKCNRGGFYIKGRFYLFMYGIPEYLVESEINGFERQAGLGPEKSFFGQEGDYVEWTQERNVSIKVDNYYRINPIFTTLRTYTGKNRILPNVYQRKFWDCTAYKPNGVIWSLRDVSESDIYDPWLTFRALDYHEFSTDSGKLIDMKGIESELIMARFEDRVSVYNSIDVMAERLRANPELGTGGLFQERVIDYNKTELGYTGTQTKEMVSCEFGHFWVDTKRGQVFRVSPNGGDLKEITPGMRNWLKEHIPFKILQYNILNRESGEPITHEHTSNKFSGLGLSMGWDSRFRRVFITKKDYIPVFDSSLYVYNQGKFYYNPDGNMIEVKLADSTYFKDVSWTIGYNAYKDEWVSYNSFKPDFYIAHQGYFQTGINHSNDISERGLWSHILSNQSFCVFYGKRYPFSIEVPVKEGFSNQILSYVSYWMESRRYQNEVDYAVNRLMGFNKVIIYNGTYNSGLVNLAVERINSVRQRLLYPRVDANSSSILQTEVDGKISFNYFFNRVSRNINNIPIWIKDENDIDKQLNPIALTYNTRYGDRLRGDYYLARFTNDEESRYKFIVKWVEEDVKVDRR